MTPQLMPLILRHSEERDNENGGDPLKHAQISVAYAIEVLETYDTRIVKFMEESSSRDGMFITPETAKEVWGKTTWHLEIASLVEQLKKQLQNHGYSTRKSL